MKLLTILMVICSTGVYTSPLPESSADLKMEARVDDDVEDYNSAPGFFSFHKGEAFTVEKDPVTGNLDFNKKETPDYGFYKEDIDRKDISRPKQPLYHTPNDIPSNPFKISAIDSSPDLHQFLNLPVHYSTSGKFPLISSSYANMKVQGSSGTSSVSSNSGGSNHRHYTPATSSSTTHAPSYYTSVTMKSTTLVPSSYSTTQRTTTYQTSTTTRPTITTTSTTTHRPATSTTTRTTTTEKLPPKIIPQQVWNISEPMDYLPEEEVSYVDYEYDPELNPNQYSQQNSHGGQQTHNEHNNIHNFQQHHQQQQQKETVGVPQHEQNSVKLSESKPPSTTTTSTTTTTQPPQTTPKTTTTTPRVSIVTSLPISTSPYTEASSKASSTVKPTEKNGVQSSTSMPVQTSQEDKRPAGVGSNFLYKEQLVENTLNNFYRPSSNEEPFRPMPSGNNQNKEPIQEENSSAPERPTINEGQRVQLPNQKPQSVKQSEQNKPDTPFPFETNDYDEENYYQKQPIKPVRPINQNRPDTFNLEQTNRPHLNQQQIIKPERPLKQEPPFAFESNPGQLQNQFNRPDRPNKFVPNNEGQQQFESNLKPQQPQFQKLPNPSGVTQFTAHLATGAVQHKKPINQNIHPSDLRPPPPPVYIEEEGSDEDLNLVKEPVKQVQINTNSRPPPISTSDGFVNIQPGGKIQGMVPIGVPTEFDQNSQSYSLQTSFSIGASDDRHPVAQGSVIDENINKINRSDIRPLRPQNVRPQNERPQNERPVNVRPIQNERPQNIRLPQNERPQNIRPQNERPINGRPQRPQIQLQPGQHWESYTPHHFPNNKMKAESEAIKGNLPNILPQFRPNAKVGQEAPNTQYVPGSLERVKQPLEHLQPPPLPRPQYLRIDRNDEEVLDNMMLGGKQGMRVFPKTAPGPGVNKVTTLQMMQQGQGLPNIPMKRIIRNENKPLQKHQKPIMDMKAQIQGVTEKTDSGKPGVHVVYPTSNQRLTPNNEDVVVVGAHGPQRPSSPLNLQHIDDDPFPLDDPVPFLMSDRERDTPILKTKPIKPLKNDFPYSLVKPNDLLDEPKKPLDLDVGENKIKHEYTAFSPTESTVKKMDPDPETNVIPYLQDYSPYATRKPGLNKPISVTLKNILANPTPKPNAGMIERVEIKTPANKNKYISGNQEITVGAMIDMHSGNHKTNPVSQFTAPVEATSHHSEVQINSNTKVVRPQSHTGMISGEIYPQDFQAPFQPSSLSNPENQGWRVIGNITKEHPEDRIEDSETTIKPSEFSFEQFKPQLFGGFKPIVPSDDEEELELDA